MSDGSLHILKQKIQLTFWFLSSFSFKRLTGLFEPTKKAVAYFQLKKSNKVGMQSKMFCENSYEEHRAVSIFREKGNYCMDLNMQ